MSRRPDVRTICLRDHIEKLSKVDNVLEIYLFGSRAFKTGCLTSDIDILIYYDSDNGLDINALISLHKEETALDLFKTYDKRYAESIINGSHISHNSLIDSLHAKLLWSKESGYNEEMLCNYQQIDVHIKADFKMSICCYYSKEEMAFFDKFGHNAVFVIMPFREECDQIYSIIQDTFFNRGFTVTKASDYEFKDDLWENVKVYLDCCRAAVSIFHYDDSKKYNPNVAIETGYVMADMDNKSICLLKDKRLEHLPTDFLGKLYKQYDMDHLDNLNKQLNDWIDNYLD